MPRTAFRTFFGLLLIALSLLGCTREQPAAAPGDPVAAVQALADALRDNDLVRYSELSLPPPLHARVEAHWDARIARAEPVDEKDREKFDRLLVRLTEDGAEASLLKAFDARMKKIEPELAGQWPLMQTTATIFIKAVIEANDTLSDAEKNHALAAMDALLAWAQPSLFTDREKARLAIIELVAVTRELDLTSLEQIHALQLRPALEKSGIALAGLKRIGLLYGLDVDDSLANLKVKLLAAEGDTATVEVSYPLLGESVAFEMNLIRRDQGWYSANTVAQAEADLAEDDATMAAASQPLGTPPPSTDATDALAD